MSHTLRTAPAGFRALPRASHRPGAGLLPILPISGCSTTHIRQQRMPKASSGPGDHGPQLTPLVQRMPPTPAAAPKAHPTSVSGPSAQVLAASMAIGLALMAGPALASSSTHDHGLMEQFQLAEGGQEFWSNIARYGRYFLTVMLGTGYVMLRPITSAFKNPVTAVFTLAGIAGTVYFVKFTLEAMLGLSSEPFDYVQGQF